MLYVFLVAHKAACQTLSKAFLKFMNTWVKVLLVLEIFLTEDFKVEDLLCVATPCPEACMLFSNDLLRYRLQSVKYDI